MSQVLVTGAGGFLGRRLVRALVRAGHTVVAATRDPKAWDERGSRAVRLELTECEASRFLPDGIDTIVHTAAARPKSDRDTNAARQAFQVNGIGTLQLLDYAERRRIPRFIYCSSIALYRLPQPVPIREDGAVYPVPRADGIYAMTKLLGELFCESRRHAGGPRCLSLRLGRIYGPGERPEDLLGQWISKASASQEIEVYGEGERSLDFIYIEDAVRALRGAVESDWEGGVINVATGVETRWRTLAETIVKVFSPVNRPASIRMLSHGSRLRCYLDIQRARDLLGFVPRFSLEEGLRVWKKTQDKEEKTVECERTAHSPSGY